MSHNRKEPTLSSPSSSANLSEKRASGGSNGNASVQSALRPQQVIVKKQSSVLLWLTFLLTLGIAGAAGYTFWQLYNAKQFIAQQQISITALENQLTLADDESTQSLTALTANVKGLSKELKRALSEVDKLWSARNSNRKSIAGNKEQLTKNISQLKQLKQSLVATEGKLNKPVASLKQRSSEQELLIQSLRERLSNQAKRLDTLSSQSKEYAAKYVSKKDLTALSNKVSKNDEAIDAFDKFRVTVNRDLLSIKQNSNSNKGAASP